MLLYIGRRTLWSLVTVVLVSITVFGLIHLIPGNPAEVVLGFRSTPYALGNLRKALGLDKPLLMQYGDFWLNLFHGNMGMSLKFRVPVLDVVLPRLGATLFLACYSTIISVFCGFTIGIISAIKKGSAAIDLSVKALLLIGVALPSFWVGTLLILGFSLEISIFPASGYGIGFLGHVESLFLPAVTLAIWQTALIARNLRTGMIEVMQAPYVDFARSMGLPARVVLSRYVIRNSLLSTVTLIGINVSFLFAGAVIVESVFTIPGAGLILVDSVYSRDYPVIESVTFLFAVLVILVNFITDIIYPFIDRRVTLT